MDKLTQGAPLRTGAPLRKNRVSSVHQPTEATFGSKRLTAREVRESVRRYKAAAQREAISEKLRDAIRRQRRNLKYANVYEEQSGNLSRVGDMWPLGAPGFSTRKEQKCADIEVKALRRLVMDSMYSCMDAGFEAFKTYTEGVDFSGLDDSELHDLCFGAIQEQSPDVATEQAGLIANLGTVASFVAGAIKGGGPSQVVNTLRATTDSFREVGSAAASIESCLTKIQQMFQDTYESFMKFVPVALAGSVMIAFVFWIYGSQRIPSFLWTFICFIVMQILGAQAWESVKGHFAAPEAIEEQSGFGTGCAAAVLAFMMRGSVAAFCDRGMTAPASSFLMREIGSAPRAFGAMKELFEWVIKAVEKIVNYFLSCLDKPPIRLVNQYGAEIDKLVVDVATVVQYEMSTKPDKDAAQIRLNRIMGLLATCWNYKNMYRGNRDVMHELEVLTNALNRHAIRLRAEVGGACGYTQLPVSVCLYGEAGVGKTMMVQNLVTTVLKEAELLSEDITEEEASKVIFTKPFNSEYMDGYYGQPVYLLDDLMMKKATPADTSNGLLDLLTYYSSFTNIVNKAQCEDKGMWPFSSKIIMMTTNMKHFDQANASQVFLHLPALERRVDIHYCVCVRPEYRVEGGTGLDYSKFEIEWAKCIAANGDTSGAYPWYIWEVFPASFSGNDAVPVPGTGMPFERVIAEMIEKLQARKGSHLNALTAARNILSAPKAGLEKWKNVAGIQQQSPEIVASKQLFTGFDVTDPSVVQQMMVKPKRKSAWPSLITRPVWMSEEESDEEDDLDSTSTVFDDFEVEGVKVPWWQGMRWRVKNWVCGVVTAVLDFVKEHALIVAAITLLLGGAIALLARACQGLWETMRSFFISETIEEQSNRPHSRAVTYGKLKQQSGHFHEGNHRLVYNNSFKLCVRTTCGSLTVLGQVTYLEMDYMVMPKHFDQKITEALAKGDLTRDSEVLMRACRSAEECIRLTVGHFLDFPRSEAAFRDLCFVRTINLHTARKITGFLVTENDMKDVGGLPVRLDTARVESDGELVAFNDRIAFMSKSVEVGRHGVTIGSTRHLNWYSYAADTILGDCGAPLCLQKSQRFQHRVWLGLHVGCKVGFGQAYATQLTAELVERHLNDLKSETRDPRVKEASFQETVEQAGLVIPVGFSVQETDEMPFKGGDVTDEELLGFGSFSGIGTLSRVVSAPVRTNLTTTFVYEDDMLDEVMPLFTLKPMRLAPYMVDDELVYPSVEALRPYAGGVISIDLGLVRSAIPMAMKPFSNSSLNVSGRVWSVSEALVGVNGAKGIPLGTSVGLPGCIDHRNKRSMLGGSMEWDLEKKEVVDFMGEVERLEAMCKEGVRPFFMARGFLKDELRKPGKSARYIAGTNVHYYTLCRMYFGQIVSTQMNQFKESGMCPGINPYQDWEWLQNFVTKHGDKVWDGDFSGFDTSQQPQLLGECLNFINSWYKMRGATDSENAVRTVLFQDLMKSRHAVGRGVVATHVVQWQRSLPSGHFLTTFINSMLSMVCIVAAFIRTTGRDDFWDCASVASLGDDNLVGAADEVIGEFNQETVASVLKREFNMVYTAGRKGEELKPYLSIPEVSFLQRTFRLKQNVVVGPIRKESIFGALLYTKKGDVRYRTEVMCQNIEGALSELSLWPEEEWTRSIGPILGVAKRLGYTPRFLVDSSQDYFEFTCSRQDTGWF